MFWMIYIPLPFRAYVEASPLKKKKIDVQVADTCDEPYHTDVQVPGIPDDPHV